MASFSLFKYIVPEYVTKNCSVHTMLPVCLLCQRQPLGIKQQFGSSSLDKISSPFFISLVLKANELSFFCVSMFSGISWLVYDLFRQSCWCNFRETPLPMGFFFLLFSLFSQWVSLGWLTGAQVRCYLEKHWGRFVQKGFM